MNWPKVSWKKIEEKQEAIQLPASKSISNRLLILRAISTNTFHIDNLSKANDTQLLEKILSHPALPPILNCQDAGTAYRFLTCLCATKNNEYLLQGTPRLLHRPMTPLIVALRQLGAVIKEPAHDKNTGLVVKGTNLKSSPLQVRGDVSSQFISALCLIASEIDGGLDLQIEPPVYSKPYIQMTLQLLQQFGVQSHFKKNHIRIEKQALVAKNFQVEADWSSACFFYCLLMLTDEISSLRINELQEDSIQGDSAISKIAKQFGVNTTFEAKGATLQKTKKVNAHKEINLEDFPDLAVPLLTVAALAHSGFVFTGLSHLEHKESNRITALATNLSKFGIELHNEAGSLSFNQKEKIPNKRSVRIETFNDHRIAMSFSLLAILGYDIQLDNASCVDKSFPDFFKEVSKLGFRLH